MGTTFPDFLQRNGHVRVDILLRGAVGGGGSKIRGVRAAIVAGIWGGGTATVQRRRRRRLEGGGDGGVTAAAVREEQAEEFVSGPPTLRALAETDLDQFAVRGGYAVDEASERSFDAFGFVDLLGERPEDHAQLVEVGLDADAHADALAAVDQTAEFGRFPADGTSSPVDIDDPGVVVLVDDDVGESEIALDEPGFVDVGKALDDLLGPLLPSRPGKSAVVVVEDIDQGSSGCI